MKSSTQGGGWFNGWRFRRLPGIITGPVGNEGTDGRLARILGTGRRRADAARGASAHARDDAPNPAHKTGAEQFYFILNLPIDLRASLKKFRDGRFFVFYLATGGNCFSRKMMQRAA